LEGQAHEGMTTAPELYAEAVISFLLHSARPGSGALEAEERPRNHLRAPSNCGRYSFSKRSRSW
jgi:hypothetical protein